VGAEQTGSSGESFVFEIDSTATDCVNWVQMGDGIGSPCGGGWGIESAVWVNAY
jgi:hypothetical protein